MSHFGVITEIARPKDLSVTVDTQYQPYPIYRTITTDAELLAAMKDCSHFFANAASFQMPTAAQLNAIYPTLQTGNVIDLWFVNIRAGTVGLTANTGVTIPATTITIDRCNMVPFTDVATQYFPTRHIALLKTGATSYTLHAYTLA